MHRSWVLPLVLVACTPPPTRPKPVDKDTQPPVADKRPHDVPSPNGSRNDPYYWLRDDTRKSADVLGYLNAENAYAKTVLAPVEQLEKQLYDEMRGHIKEDDTDVPTFEEGYFYYAKYAVGQEHPVYVRRKGAMDAAEEVILDGNALAKGHEFFSLGGHRVSRDGRYLAWTDDIVGRRQYVLHVKDLNDGKLLPDTAINVSPSLAWANDSRTLFYTGKDTTTLREDRVFRHTLGTEAHTLVFREEDGSYYVSVDDMKSHKYVQIDLESTTNTEVRLIDADRPALAPRVFLPRAKDHLYGVDHVDGRFVIRTNDSAKNFRLVYVADGKEADHGAWHDLVAARADQLVEGFAIYHHFIAASVRTGGLRKVLVLVGSQAPYYIDAPETPAVMNVIDTPNARSTKVRYAYTSMITPSSVYELDVDSHAKQLLKQRAVPNYDPAKYETTYLHAPAEDGTPVPISVVHAKSTKLDGTAPLVVYGYGSYGASMDPYFDSNRLALLDRGVVYAIAHIRGGQEKGRAWYEAGKLMHKKNTFTDFIAATEYLVKQELGARDQVYAIGGSAGGLLMGAVLNLRPDLYRGVIAAVPFVDVVTTMLDESIPLTTNEFDEWGNPKEADAYRYMLSYSPYDNIKAQPYPSIYCKTGLWDSQVQYYEPTKWVAKLRAMKTDANLLVLDVDMAAGHGGKSGRFDRLRDIAREYAFILMVRDRPDKRAHWPRGR